MYFRTEMASLINLNDGQVVSFLTESTLDSVSKKGLFLFVRNMNEIKISPTTLIL